MKCSRKDYHLKWWKKVMGCAKCLSKIEGVYRGRRWWRNRIVAGEKKIFILNWKGLSKKRPYIGSLL